jgi:hypothetical protein
MSSSQDAHAGSEKTPYGFQWGNAVISRACEHKGHRLLMIETPRERIMIRVTPSGLIRVDGFEANTGEKLSVTF